MRMRGSGSSSVSVSSSHSRRVTHLCVARTLILEPLACAALSAAASAVASSAVLLGSRMADGWQAMCLYAADTT